MLRITITQKGEAPVTREYDKTEVTIGRGPGNDIVLASERVSKNHAQLLFNFSRRSVVVIDRRTTNGTAINGKAIEGPHPLQPGEVLSIADYTIDVEIVGEMAEPTRTEFLQPEARRKRKLGDPAETDFDAFGDSQVIGEGPWDPSAETADLAALKAAAAGTPDQRRTTSLEPMGLEPTKKAPSADPVAGGGAREPEPAAAAGRGRRPSVAAAVAAAGPTPPAARAADGEEGLRRVVACLERYIKLDDTYRAEAFGKPCVCGVCLLCEAKAALDQVNQDRAQRRRPR